VQRHWVLDVQLGEDPCRVRHQHTAQNLAVLQAMCVNLLRRDKTKKCGLRTKQKIDGWNYRDLLHLLKV